MLSDNSVLQSPVFETHSYHLAAGFFHGLLDSHRHLARLTLAHSDTTITVAHYCQSSEPKNPPALHHFRDAVDGHHLLAQSITAIITNLLHAALGHACFPLELESRFAGSLCKRLYAPMEPES